MRQCFKLHTTLFDLSSALEKWEKSARLEDALLYFTSISCLTAQDAASGWPSDTHFRCEDVAVAGLTLPEPLSWTEHCPPALQCLIHLPFTFQFFYSQITLVKVLSGLIITLLLLLSVLRCVRHAESVITPDIVWIIADCFKVVPMSTMTCCASCVDSTKVNIAVSHRINTDVSVCFHTCVNLIHLMQNIKG